MKKLSKPWECPLIYQRRAVLLSSWHLTDSLEDYRKRASLDAFHAEAGDGLSTEGVQGSLDRLEYRPKGVPQKYYSVSGKITRYEKVSQ